MQHGFVLNQLYQYVGVIRSLSGNLPSPLNRLRCHNRALGAILSSGLARKHQVNPAAALQDYNIQYSLCPSPYVRFVRFCLKANRNQFHFSTSQEETAHRYPRPSSIFSVWQLTWQSHFASKTVVYLWYDHPSL